MAAKKYIAINAAADATEERDLLKDVGELAYVDRGEIAAPFDVHSLGIGSHRFSASNWTNVTHAPANLPASGHFLVWVSDVNTKEIRYVADESNTVDCVTSRCAELVIIEGQAENWNYYVSSDETYQFGEIALPSGYDKGKALDTKLTTLPANYVRQYAYLNRGKRSGAINFDTFLSHGNTYLEIGSGSTSAPPTTQTTGRIRVEIAGCNITQYWYPENSNSLFFRERSASKIWGSWYTATEGNVKNADKVRVPTFYRRGVASGYQDIEVYSATHSDNNFRYTPGYGIAIVGNVISYTGTAIAISGLSPINYNSTTGQISLGALSISNTTGLQAALDSKLSSYTETDPTVGAWIKAITSTQISNWNTAYSWGNHAGLYPLLSGSYENPAWITSLAWSKITGVPDFSGNYAPLSRSLTVQGTTSNIVVTGGAQTLAADRTWTVNLAALHASPLSGGSGTQVPYFTTDIYGRVTGITNTNITFPVTSVNGQTGAVALTTSNIAEGANLYWTTARGDARYSLLGHTHTYADITGKPLTFNPASHTHPYTEVTGITAGTGITYSGGVIASTITQYTNAMAQAAELDPFGYAWHYFGVSGTQITLEINRRNSTTGYASFNIPALPISHITGLQSALDGKTPYGHTHDDRYYTETESDGRFTQYGHTHDDRYYTETESDGRFTQFGHTHDDRYYTEGEVNSLLSNKSNTGHGHWYTDISGAPWLTSESDPTEVTSLSASVGSTNMQLYIGKKNGGTVGSGVIDMSNIAYLDPYGVADMWLSYSGGTLSVNIQLRNSTVITRTVYLGGGG